MTNTGKEMAQIIIKICVHVTRAKAIILKKIAALLLVSKE